jgi:hypothetical protein
MSAQQRRNILTQASLEDDIWEEVTKVMDMYELGETKDQRLTTKQLTSKCQWRPYYISPLITLPRDIQVIL